MNRHYSTRPPPSRSCDPLTGLVSALLDRRVSDLSIEVRCDGLILRGRTSSSRVKQLAQHAAMSVTDLPLVANEIEVVGFRDERSDPDEAEVRQGEAEPPKTLVLLATGDDRLRSVSRHHLATHGFAVATAADGVECVTLIRELNPDVDVVVLDSDLLWGGADGVVAHLRARNIEPLPVVLLTSRPADSHGRESPFDSPIVSVLGKPVPPEILLRAVRSAAGERLDRA